MALPLLLLLALGSLQLILMHQARLLMEYAAFSAVRVGVVWSGSLERMRNAALSATLPLYGRTDSPAALAATRIRQRRLDDAFLRLPAAAERSSFASEVTAVPTGGLVRVDTLNPRHSVALASAARRAGEGEWRELEFDRVGTFPEGEVAPDPARDETLRAATVLRVRIEALYELKVPFANAVLFWAWRRARSLGVVSPTPSRDEALLNGLADGTLWLEDGSARRRRYFLPLSAEYRMRMQSNFFRKWVMH